MINSMNKNQECDLIIDLLPLFVEQRTSEESDAFIRAHLEQCEECRKNLEYMEISYEDLWQKPVPGKQKKKATVFGRAKGKLFVYGYLLFLFLVWVYIVQLFGTIL